RTHTNHGFADAAQSDQRNTAIDSLRVAMMSVVMLGHPLLPYTTVPRRFKDPETLPAVDVLAVFLYGFAMPAFFVTAGFAASALYARRGSAAFWKNRGLRIALPLVVGYVLLTPLTRAAYEFAQMAAQTGSLASAWQVVTEARWLRWGKVYHLWFLASLVLFSGGAVIVQSLANAQTDRVASAAARAKRALFQARGLVGLTLFVAAFMIPSYSTGTGQGTDGWMQLAVFGFFLLGWTLFQWRDLLPKLTARWWLGPVVALAVMPLCGWATRERLLAEDAADLKLGLIAGGTNAILAVAMTLGLLGIFQRFFATRGALGQYVSDASYWIYLIHFPVVIAAGGVMSVFELPALVKYLATIALSLPVILGSYEVLVRRSPMGKVLGAAPRKVTSGPTP
ncbi:MAG: acyltransferase family protein, partial [Pseudomonadota bacterium]